MIICKKKKKIANPDNTTSCIRSSTYLFLSSKKLENMSMPTSTIITCFIPCSEKASDGLGGDTNNLVGWSSCPRREAGPAILATKHKSE